MEPITDPNKKRYCIFPIEYNDIWNMYNIQLNCFWQANEINFSKDKYDFEILNKNDQHAIKVILAFFANSDGLVNANIKEKLNSQITITEINLLYDYIAMMENIHNICYSQMLITIVEDQKEQNELLNAIKTKPIIKKISEWARNYTTENTTLAENILAFCCFEGIIFSSIFAIIFYLKDKYKGLMQGFIMSNDFISRDEGQHLQTGFLIYKYLKYTPSKDKIIKIIDEAVSLSFELADETLKIDQLGMNKELMKEYIKYVGDIVAFNIINEKIYNAENKFSFMKSISLLSKSNFFEKRVSEYQLAHQYTNNNFDFTTSDEF